MIEIRLMHNALVLAEHRSFARAADALNISQPTLSRNIQALEQRIGARLFDRMARTTIPTPLGEEFLKHARTAVAASRALDEGMRQFMDLDSGEMTIGTGIAAAGGILGSAVVRFHARYPNVVLSIKVDDWRCLPEHLRNGEIDLIVAEVSECDDDADLVATPLQQHQAYFFCRPGHPLLAAGHCRLADVLSWPLALPELPQRLWRCFDAAIRDDGGALRPGLSPRDLNVINSNDLAVNQTIITQSDVIGLATFGMLEAPLRRGELALLPLRLPELLSNYGLVTRRGISLSPVAQVFTSMLREEDHALAEREQSIMRQ